MSAIVFRNEFTAALSPPSAAAGFASVVAGLSRALVERQWHLAFILWPSIAYISRRVEKIDRQVRRLVALIAAGKISPPKFNWPRPPRNYAAPPGPAAGRPDHIGIRYLFQWRFGWLDRVLPEGEESPGVAPFAAEMAAWLAAPKTRALLLASPRLRKVLRPLVWMLGVDPTPLRSPGPVPVSAAVSPPESAPPSREDWSAARADAVGARGATARADPPTHAGRAMAARTVPPARASFFERG